MRKLTIIAFIMFFGQSLNAQENLKVMFYNLLEFPEASPGNREVILQNILGEYLPDIFMVCELQDEVGADLILNTSLNASANLYERASYVENTSGDSDLQQLIYFRKDKFSLENSEIIQTTIRDINNYQLKLNTVNGGSNPIVLNIYVSHLKSSQGTANQNLRLDMVNEFISTLDDLDSNAFVIFAGDLNVYTASEPAYQKLLDTTNPIVLVDPIDTPGSWNNNDSFQDIHTQSTRVSSAPFGAGAGGGLDDRFDFILVSQNILTNTSLKYKTDTYKAYGNNGNCFNRDISDVNCGGEFNQQTRNRLFSMSDHLPVVLELETEEEIVLNTQETVANILDVLIENTIASDKVYLKIPAEIYTEIAYEIYNTLGQKVKSISAKSTKKEEIDITAFSEGIYYIKTNQFSNKTLKFLKNSY